MTSTKPPTQNKPSTIEDPKKEELPKVDKFAKFKDGDDYIFKIEHLPTALEMLDQEMQKQKEKTKKARQEALKQKQFTIKEKYTSAFQFDYVDEGTDHEIGFLHELGSTFKSTKDDLRTNYLIVIDKILAQTHS